MIHVSLLSSYYWYAYHYYYYYYHLLSISIVPTIIYYSIIYCYISSIQWRFLNILWVSEVVPLNPKAPSSCTCHPPCRWPRAYLPWYEIPKKLQIQSDSELKNAFKNDFDIISPDISIKYWGWSGKASHVHPPKLAGYMRIPLTQLHDVKYWLNVVESTWFITT
jgi:hypothetical protein